MIPFRLGVVIGLLLLFVVGRRMYLGWRTRQRATTAPNPSDPRVPIELLDTNGNTWIVFTTPLCTSCGPVVERLRADHAGSAIVVVDATREPQLAQAFRVRAAPTVLLADAAGVVSQRLVGADSVERYLRQRHATSA